MTRLDLTVDEELSTGFEPYLRTTNRFKKGASL
jgi:hypothetical protein